MTRPRFPAPETFAALTALVALASGCAPLPLSGEPRVRGPLLSRNLQPVALTELALPPRRAATQPEGRTGVRVEAAYASIFESDAFGGERVRMDGEILRTAVRVRHGLGPDTDFSAEVAALYASGGFLDGFVEAFHGLFGFPDGGRSNAPQDDYSMRLVKGTDVFYDVPSNEVSFGDLPLIVTHRVRREEGGGPGVALRAGVELPTGSEANGTSNGGVDWGAGVVLEKNFRRWGITGGVDYVLPATPGSFSAAGVELSNVLQLQNGYEFRWSDHLSLLLQLFWTSAMTDDFTLEEFGRDIFDVGLGFAVDAPGGATIVVSFHEDLVAATGTDFGVLLAATWGF